MRIIVIGAGIIGTTTAYFLAREGHDVCVVDRQEGCGLETSFANGGLVTPSQSDPWNAPGTLRRMLKWLGREDSPLLLRPRALPAMSGWLVRFLIASRRGRFHRSMAASARLAAYSREQLDELRTNLSLQYMANTYGTLKIFTDQDELNEAIELAKILSRYGINYRPLDASATVEIEPALQPVQEKLTGALYYEDDESGDAYRFTCELARHARALGVEFLFGTTVTNLTLGQGRISSLATNNGELKADAYVLAAGSYSPGISKMAGIRLPVRPVKGYSVTVPLGEWEGAPRIPLVDFGRKIVIARLGDRLRMAGTAELAGYDTTLNPVRSENILKLTLEVLPELRSHLVHTTPEYWCGLRPVTFDGPPVVGASPCANLYFNTGHGPLGWTMAAGSGRLVADIISGRRPDISTAGLTYVRFR